MPMSRPARTSLCCDAQERRRAMVLVDRAQEASPDAPWARGDDLGRSGDGPGGAGDHHVALPVLRARAAGGATRRLTRLVAVPRTRPVMRVHAGNGHHHTAGAFE